MSDQQLREYLPNYGDRIVVTAFARNMGKKKVVEESQSGSRKKDLIDRLSHKLSNKSGENDHEHETRSKAQYGNKNAQKTSRRVQVGWIDFDSKCQEFKQVQ